MKQDMGKSTEQFARVFIVICVLVIGFMTIAAIKTHAHNSRSKECNEWIASVKYINHYTNSTDVPTYSSCMINQGYASGQ